jgi:hypothetical protein
MSSLSRLPLAIAMLALGAHAASASTAYGDLNNFDAVNDTGQECHGFEIEIDGVRSTDITYTYDWNHYGAPKIREDLSDAANPKVFIRYESAKNPDGSWAAYTAMPAAPLTPTDGHSCTNPSVNDGCEHFGVGYYGAPTAIRYNWLIDDGTGSLALGPAVAVATPTWTYNPPVLVDPALPPDPANIAQPANVVAAIPAPELEIPPGKAFGEPLWMKVIKTTTHNANPVALGDLISDDLDNDGKAEWQNREPDEVETEWKLVQNRADGGDVVDALAPDEMGDGNDVVTRRYEFYRYVDNNPIGAGSIDGETGEAMCDKVAADGVQGVGLRTVSNAAGDSYEFDCSTLAVVGDYVGAQMAAFAAEAPLGLVDHVQDAEPAAPYTPRTVVIGGDSPYAISVTTGALPPGMSLGDYVDPESGNVIPGVLSGTPTTAGRYSFTVAVTDAAGTTVSQPYTLQVGAGAPLQYQLGVGSTGTGSGAIDVGGSNCGAACSMTFDAGSTATLTATPAADSLFKGWSGGGCAGTAGCTVTLDGDTFVNATFDKKQYTLTAAKAGTGTGRVSGNGIDCGNSCSATLDIGTPVSLTAAPDAGMVFSGWSGACTGTGACSFALNAAASVTATFAPAPAPAPSKYTLSVVRTGSGSVTSKPSGISCGTLCSASFSSGTSVTLTAKPSTRKVVFAGWTGACSGTALTCKVTMNANQSVTATFK